MLGPRRLLQLLALQEHFAPPGAVVTTHVQTNGTVVDDRIRRVLRLFELRTSVSLDGTRRLHDRTRRDKAGRSTWEAVRTGISALRDDGTLTGVLLVVTPDVLVEDPAVLWADVVSTGTPSVCFLAERPRPGHPSPVSTREYVGFLARMAQERQRSGADVAIREVDAIGRLLDSEQSGFCELAGNCVGHFVAVDPDGSVSHCDKYLGDEAYVLGNLVTDDLSDILRGARAAGLRARASAEVRSLAGCRWSALCQGWCPHERYVDATWSAEGCCGLAPLFEHLERSRAARR